MRSGLCYPLFVLLLAVYGFAAGAQEPDADPEDVPTPLTLEQLLPPGGVEAVDIDFYIRTDATVNGRAMDVRFMRWSIRAVDSNLVVTYDTGTKGEAQEHRRARTTYSKDGKILDYYQVSHRQGKKTSEITGKAEGEELILDTSRLSPDGKVIDRKTQRRSLTPLKTTVPSEWFPLIVAYHIRKKSLGYSFARTDLHFHLQHADTRIKDVGTETVEHEGRKVEARLLLGERTFGKNNQPGEVDSRLQYLALPSGELMYIRNQYGSYKFLGYRKTREQIEEEFWLIPEEAGE